MPQSNALTVIATPAVSDDLATPAGALIPNYGDRVVQNGPGMHLNLAFSAGGVYVEAGLRGVAKLLGLGPVPVVQAVETIFADSAQRIAILDELFLLRARPVDENSVAQPQTAPKASKTIVKLKKLCRKVLKFTCSSELPDTQILAYKGIVMLTTRYIGLRLLFVEHLLFKNSLQQLSKRDIVRAWRHGSSGDPEWEFWLEFAAYCVASPDQITAIVEALKPSNFGCFERGQCISEHLSHWISSTLAANDESRLLAIRHLAGILELPSFWDFRIKNDLHSASDGVCLISIRLLEDLAVECEERHFTFINDLVTLDPEGINMLMFATLNLLPLKLLPDDDMRSTTSLEIAERLVQRLQTDRSKALFPDASERAKTFLPKLETAPDIHAEIPTSPSNPEAGAPSVKSIQRSQSETDAETAPDIWVEIPTPPSSAADDASSVRSIQRSQGETHAETAPDIQEEILTPSNPMDDAPEVQKMGDYLNIPLRPPPPQSSHTAVEINALTQDDIIIAVMGATKSGKSSFISMAIGGDYEMIGHGLESHTREVRAVRYRHPSDSSRTYVFLDTPGFDDTYLSDADILISISNWLTATYKRHMLITGLLFLHPISDNRMSGSALRNTDMFQMICGDSAFPNVVIVTTMWDQVTKEVGESRERELRDTFWQPMIDKHSQTARFHHTTESAWDVLNQFTKEHRPIKLKIQTQMVDEGIPLAKTTAGAFLRSWLTVLSKKLKLMAGWFKTKHRDEPNNPALSAEVERLNEKIQQVEVQQDLLGGKSMRSNHSLGSHRSGDGSLISDSSSSPFVTAPSSPISPPPSSISSSSRHRASKAIRAAFKPSQERRQKFPQMGPAQKESEMWGKYGTITFPTNSYPRTRNMLETVKEPSSYSPSPDRNRYDSHTFGKRHDSIPLNTSSEALSRPQRANTGASASTSDAAMPLAVRLLSNVHSLAFEVANFIDDIANSSELAATVAEDARRLTAASQSQGYSGPIEVVQSLYRDLQVLRQMLITQQGGEIDQETFQEPFLACQKSLKKFSKSVPRPSTTSNKRWRYYDMDVQQDRP